MASNITKLSCVFLLVCLFISCIHAIPRRLRNGPVNKNFKPCPNGWEMLDSRKTCIRISYDTDSWVSAGRWCELLGGRLTVIGQNDIGPILRLISRRKLSGQSTGKYWTDAVIIDDPSVFKSMYSKRVPFIPPNIQMLLPLPYQQYPTFKAPKLDKNCLAIEENGAFLKESCNSDYHYICEKI